jgi:hypothetical protein
LAVGGEVNRVQNKTETRYLSSAFYLSTGWLA